MLCSVVGSTSDVDEQEAPGCEGSVFLQNVVTIHQST